MRFRNPLPAAAAAARVLGAMVLATGASSAAGIAAGPATTGAAGAAAGVERAVNAGSVTVSLDESHLVSLGLQVAATRGSDTAQPPLYTFAVRPGAAISVDGGFALAVHDVRTGAARPPLYLFDFAVDVKPGGGRTATFRPADPSVPPPLEIWSAPAVVDADGALTVTGGDLRVGAEWAARIGRPELAGQWIGSASLRLDAVPSADPGPQPQPPVPSPLPGPPDHPRDGPPLDLALAELYGLASQGHTGVFPLGVTGFSAATTVCNVGQVPVPWVGPGFSGTMGETHPFVGLAMYREDAAGTLEMIGTNWIKHGFNALNHDQCGLGCAGGGGGVLGVGCSDTYSAANNGDRAYLGPREEVDPFLGTWEACDSFFDDFPADCRRDYFGIEVSPVLHRLAVTDADLNVPGARFFYEAIYYTAGDFYAWNGAGWREVLLSWIGSAWMTSTPGGLAPQPGPLAASWGDAQSVRAVAPDDGEVVLSVRVTPLGGGQWRYEYALYNWRSRRGVGALEIPVGAANVGNVGFRDLDGAGADDWTATVAGGTVRWETTSQALRYQTMFNFRFDADLPPVDAAAEGWAFDPGVRGRFALATRAPAAAAPDPESETAAAAPDPGAHSATAGEPAAAAAAGPGLSIAGANPAAGAGATSLAVTLPRAETVRVTVTDAAGRTVKVLAERRLPAGRTDLRWDGRDSRGGRAAAGVYFVRLAAGGVTRTEKITRLP